MFLDNAMERINRLILQGGRNGMTELQFYAAEIREWKNSLKRMDQIKGADYYEGRHDILNRKRTIIGADGKLQEVDNLPNNRLIDNQYALMVDQKTNYLVGKPFTVNCQNKAYADALNNVFNKRSRSMTKRAIWPSNISRPMKFFRFGLTMITPSLILLSVFTRRKCGMDIPRKSLNGLNCSRPMAFTGISMMEAN